MGDPRFNFYPDNFEGGTDGFTLEQDGAYLRLLILQFRYGCFTADQAIDKMLRHTRGNAAASAGLWKFLMPKFIPDEFDGIWFWNERLKKEIEKSAKESKNQSDRAKSGWITRKSGIQSGSAAADAFSSISSKDIYLESNILESSTKDKKHSTKVQKQKTDFSVIPTQWPSEDFMILWNEFVEMRRMNKKPLTALAISRRLKELVLVSDGIWDKAQGIMIYTNDKNYDRFFRPSINGQKQTAPATLSHELIRDKA